MKYSRFEDLPVWQAAIDLAVQVFALTVRLNFKGRYSLKDQIERAAVSVSNNIAEGFERGTSRSCTSREAHVEKCGRCSASSNACQVSMI